MNADRGGDLELLGQLVQLLFIRAAADHQQGRLRLLGQHGGKGFDHAVVALVALEPAERGEHGRALAVGAGAVAGEGEVGAVRDQREALRRQAELGAVLVDLEAGDGDQPRCPPQQRPQQAALEPPRAVAQVRGVAAAVEGDDVGDAAASAPAASPAARPACGSSGCGRRPSAGGPSRARAAVPGSQSRSAGQARTVRISTPSRTSVCSLRAARLGAEHLDLGAAGGEAAAGLHHVALDPALGERAARGHHQHPRWALRARSSCSRRRAIFRARALGDEVAVGGVGEAEDDPRRRAARPPRPASREPAQEAERQRPPHVGALGLEAGVAADQGRRGSPSSVPRRGSARRSRRAARGPAGT